MAKLLAFGQEHIDQQDKAEGSEHPSRSEPHTSAHRRTTSYTTTRDLTGDRAPRRAGRTASATSVCLSADRRSNARDVTTGASTARRCYANSAWSWRSYVRTAATCPRPARTTA